MITCRPTLPLLLALAFLVRARLLPGEMRLAPRASMEACVCSNPAHCGPVTKQHDVEVFGFGGNGNWSAFGWDVMTTIAWATDAELVCHAHANDVRVIAAVPSFPATLEFLGNASARAAWITNTITLVKTQHLDGITFDYEGPITWNDPRRGFYVDFVQETTSAMHAAMPHSQVSVCAAWSPDDIDGRAYDYKRLADVSDFLYVMSYDTRSQIFDRCIASANSPASRAERGIQRYLDLGIDKNKLILGTPWYGYNYPCLSTEGGFCAIKQVLFRGVNCSDAAGSELGFADIQKLIADTRSVVKLDTSTQSLYFDFHNSADGTVHQMWFDDAATSSIKYGVAKKLGVRGVGPYRYDQLDHTGSTLPLQTRLMWDALRQFAKP